MLGFALDAESRATTIKFDETEACLGALEPIVNGLCSIQATKRVDILVMSAGGAPFDATLAQAVEAFPGALNVLKKGGVLIVAAECGQGHGGGQFYEWSAEHKEPRYLETRLRHRFNYAGFKASFLGRMLHTHRVYLVSTIPDYYVESVFGIRPAQTVNAALQTAQRVHGSDSTISIIPNPYRAVPTQPETKSSEET
jgi:nickel-dependent lactate racemase